MENELFSVTVSFSKESTPERVKLDGDTMTPAPPTNVQLLQLQVELMVMVTPGLSSSLQFEQMVPAPYIEELKLEVIGITVRAWAPADKERTHVRMNSVDRVAIWVGFIQDGFYFQEYL